MTDNQFDNFFREKLRDHTAPVPDGLWEKIRPEKERRPKGFFLPRTGRTGLMIAALVTGVAMIGLLLNQHQGNPTLYPNGTQPESVSVQPHTNANSKETSSPSDHGIAPNEVQKNDPIQKNNSFQENQPFQKNELDQKPPLPNHLNDIHQDNTTLTQPGSIASKQTGQAIPFVDAEQAEAFPVTAGISQEQMLKYSPQQVRSMSGMVLQQLASNAHDKWLKSMIIICPTTNKSRLELNPDWSLELFGSPDYSFKSVTNLTAPAAYLAKKDSSEHMQIGYSAGFRLVKPLSENILLKTGLQFTQANERFSFRNENEIKTTTVITSRTIIRSVGDTIVVTDTSTVQQIGYSIRNIKNQYRTIDIPLTVGYQFGNEDLSFGINAGVIFNLSSWYQGEILDTSYNSVPISKVGKTLYKTNIGMGLYSSLSVLKRINDNTHLFFEPYFRYNLQDMTSDQSAYKQRFHVGGLAVGLRFSLNR